ncbi:GntR family transcriptional regulator [Nonomuraea bangladeshensis]|uniref:GntR family transcriptional regulator n=1 Tax=Nonomuraea bangladeshensis TaxID=404385 RepID=UPI003C2B13E2
MAHGTTERSYRRVNPCPPARQSPRWKQILEVLNARIDSGEWGPKFKISEVKLMEEFGVARPTIRKAMERLRSADKVYTVPNLGSFVKADSPTE